MISLAVVLLVTRAFYWHPYWIPAEHMKPTLLVGDYLIATTVSHDNLHRGDVLVFQHPLNQQDYIERLIGFPGDTVQLRGGVVFLNGQALPQVADGTFEEVMGPQGPKASRPRCENTAVADGAPCTKSRFIENLPDGRYYKVVDIEVNGFADDTDVFTVPDGMLFFLGDNRDNSFDSRFSQAVGGMGFVPLQNVKGKARIVVFSSAGENIADPKTWRADRRWVWIQ